MKSFTLCTFSAKTCWIKVLLVAAVGLSAILGLNCSSNTTGPSETGILSVSHTVDDFPEGIDHLHYKGYDSSGNLVYESPEKGKASMHTLFGVPLGIVALHSEFHTGYHEELNLNVYPVDFAGSATLAISAAYHCTQFDPARLAIVDAHINGNLLVRGNLPMITNGAENTCLSVTDRYFAYNGLQQKMGTVIPAFNLDEYEIIDITLIDNQSDRNQFTAEMHAFGLNSITCGDEWPPYNNSCAWNPEHIFETALPSGQRPWGLIWWPIYACGATPCSDADTQTGLVNFKFDALPQYLISGLAGAPAPSSGKTKRLLYFHCMQGADRTGALHALYLMETDASLTLVDAFDRASKGYQKGQSQQQITPAILPSCTYVGLAQKYCLTKNPANKSKCALPARCVH